MSRQALGSTAFEVARLLAQEPVDCPICTVVAASMDRYVEALFYERVTDVPTRAEIREAGGFCRLHAPLIRDAAKAHGTALIMIDVLTNQLRALERGDFDQPPGTASPLSRFLPGVSSPPEPRPPCSLCRVEEEKEALALDGLIEALADDEARTHFERSGGLCLPHFRLAYGRVRGSAPWSTILEAEKRTLVALLDDLQRLAEMYDYRFVGPLGARASASWKRALALGAGFFRPE